jgi:hypothetical protein
MHFTAIVEDAHAIAIGDARAFASIGLIHIS